mgnify:CR=1 FL=1
MQIKNLSSAQTFGTVIASLPDDMPCTSHCCVRAGEPIKEWLGSQSFWIMFPGCRCL